MYVHVHFTIYRAPHTDERVDVSFYSHFRQSYNHKQERELREDTPNEETARGSGTSLTASIRIGQGRGNRRRRTSLDREGSISAP